MKRKINYMVGRMVVIRPNRQLVDGTNDMKIEWAPDPRFGTFEHPIDAKRASSVAMEPSLVTWPDDNIKKWFDSHSRGKSASVKIVKVPREIPTEPGIVLVDGMPKIVQVKIRSDAETHADSKRLSKRLKKALGRDWNDGF